ncbi:MAG: amino acid adenylation domain-containing protein, partial [Lentisphaeria bacterium]
LGELNSTAVADVRPSLVKQLETCALNHPDRTAAIFNSDTISYRALNLRVNQLANQLLLGGVSPEISVGIFMERSLNLLVALLATIKSGGAYVPLDPHHPSDRIELILEDAKPKMLLVDDLNSKKLKILPETKVIVLNSSSFEGGDSSNPTDSFDENRLAYTIFTSGSTGRPKGVQISHAALQNFLYAMAARPGLSAADRLLSVTTISFDIAALEMYLPILVGACVDIADQACTLDPGRLAERIKQATVVQATPATFRMLIADGWQGHTNLNVLCGGEAFPRDLADQLLERSKTVWNMYGPTETTIWSCVDQVQSGKLVAIGSPIDNTQVYVLNSARVPVPQGCIGELYIAGDGLARGYHERDDLTAEVFVSNPFSKEPNALMYRTGDLARILSDGKLECLGRVDFQVKLRGFRIELGEIETLLGQQPEVNQNVVVVKGEHDSRQLVAYVSLSAPIDPMVLKDRLKKGLPHYMVPSIILILDDLPLTPNGKIDRKKLPNPDLNDLSIHDVLTEAQTETEKTIAEIWKKILNKETVGIDQNFFDIGGYSLSAIRVLGEINKACDGQLSLNAFFETPTIRELASRAENNETTADASVITLKEGKGDSPLFCICGINMYQALADNIQSDDPVYGVFLSQETDMWLESSSGTTPTVKTLAHGYVAAIKDKQEVGPYNLTGVSFGGVLAFEVAQQLHGMGDEVNVLALLDSYLPHAVKRRAHLRLVHHFLNIRELGIGYAISVSKKWLAKVPLLSRIFSAHSLKKDSQELEGSYEDQVVLRRKSYKKAMRVYSQDMQQYHSSATFFAAGHRHRDFVGREVMKCGGWEGIIKQLDVIDVTGGHIEILKEPHVKTIAVAITKKMHPNI